MKNSSIILVNRPLGVPQESDFKLISTDLSGIKEGEILIRTHYVSVDPYMRERMTPGQSYMDEFKIGEVITGATIGEVIESRNTSFQTGQIVSIFAGWQKYNISDGSNARVISTNGFPIPALLGVLGSPGLTAYFGLHAYGKLKKQETIVISGAGGSVGSIAGQIAKRYGCRVIGISGSDKKNEYLTNELGFDATINYRDHEDMEQALRNACPDGIDVYFDNVGNHWIESVTKLINKKARMILCGQLSQYNGESVFIDARILGRITKQSATIQGIMITDYNTEQCQAAREQMVQWIEEGKLKNAVTILRGIENAVFAFTKLFQGVNTGKLLIQFSDEASM